MPHFFHVCFRLVSQPLVIPETRQDTALEEGLGYMLQHGEGEASTRQSAFVSMNEAVVLFLQCLREIKCPKRIILLGCLAFAWREHPGHWLRESILSLLLFSFAGCFFGLHPSVCLGCLLA